MTTLPPSGGIRQRRPLLIAETVCTAALVAGLYAAYRACRPGDRRAGGLVAALRGEGLVPTDTERAIGAGRVYEAKLGFMTPREQHFLTALRAATGDARWLLCPQVRLADVVQVSARFRARSRPWWRFFGVIAQWHCDVVIVSRADFRVVAVVELDDASHLRAHRRRRDRVFEEVLRQAGIPLLRDRDAARLVRAVTRHLSEENLSGVLNIAARDARPDPVN